MDTETFDQFIDQFRRDVRERLVPAERELIEADRVSNEILGEMREMGLFGLTIPSSSADRA